MIIHNVLDDDLFSSNKTSLLFLLYTLVEQCMGIKRCGFRCEILQSTEVAAW